MARYPATAGIINSQANESSLPVHVGKLMPPYVKQEDGIMIPMEKPLMEKARPADRAVKSD